MITASSNTTSSSTVMSKPLAVQKQKQKTSILVNFVAGGIGGTAGVFVTCPLDVIQTRLQSSAVISNTTGASRFGTQVFRYMKQITRTEGFFALYKGMLPNLVGIAPSRATYFAVYSKTKSFLVNTQLSNSSWTHMLSALSASISVSTLTNPIWFMKTKLQLDTSLRRKTVYEIVKDVFRNEGIKGFYRGLSASYIGSAETMVYFVLYEKLKCLLDEANRTGEDLRAVDVIVASFLAKMIATISVYPHEVVRTRLRQESSVLLHNRKYKGFFQTLSKVFREERWGGMYGGMGAHLMRQVPNTVIMFVTYETVVSLLSNQ